LRSFDLEILRLKALGAVDWSTIMLFELFNHGILAQHGRDYAQNLRETMLAGRRAARVADDPTAIEQVRRAAQAGDDGNRRLVGHRLEPGVSTDCG
jgi:hypothetical protein